MDSRVTKDIVEGFEDDFADIVTDFSQSYPELKLINFLDYWTTKNMDCLFANRYDPRELLEAISDMNALLVQILTNRSGQRDEEKIIALYFLLCLFVKQPYRLRRKIRLTCGDLIFIQNLTQDESLKGPTSDVKFVWKRLREIEAIDCVETRVIYGPSLLTNRGAKRELEFGISQQREMDEEHRKALEFIQNKIEPELMEMETLCASYEQIKESLKIDNYQDPNSNIGTNGTIREFLDRAKVVTEQLKEEFK